MQTKSLSTGVLRSAALLLGTAGFEPCLSQQPPAAVGLAEETSSSGVPATIWWGDYDGDGLPDAFGLASAGRAHLLRNTGDGSFEEVQPSAAGLAPLGSGARITTAAWSDFDGDGWLDLYLGAASGPGHLFRNAADGTFTEVTSGVGLEHGNGTTAAEWIDYDEDGRPDLLIENAVEAFFYHNLGAALFERIDLPFAPLVEPPVDPLFDTDPAALSASGSRASGVVPEPDRSRRNGPSTGTRTVVGTTDGPEAATTTSPGFSADEAGMGISAYGCFPTMMDQQTGNCVQLSSEPTLGMLYPLGPEFSVDSAGRVGIGTTAATKKLHVFDPGGADLRLEDSSTQLDLSVGSSTARMGTSSNTALTLMTDGVDRATLDTNGFLGIATASPTALLDIADPGAGISKLLRVSSFGNEVLNVNDNGSVGLGTANPIAKLHLVDTLPSARIESLSGTVLELTALSTSARIGTTSPSKVEFVAGATSSMTLDTTGFVGIGTTAPREKLHVREGPGSRPAVLVEGFINTADAGRVMLIETPDFGGYLRYDGVDNALHLGMLAGDGQDHDGLSMDRQTRNIGINQGPGSAQLGVSGLGTTLAITNTGLSSTDIGIDMLMKGPGTAVLVRALGGNAGFFETDSLSGSTALVANNVQNLGNIIEASNGSDLEFRVDSSGNTFTDGAFIGGGADYAEWLERADYTEKLAPGDVVGVRGAQVSKATRGAQQLLVISSNPALIGNALDAGEDDRDGFEVCAFVGQVPVRVVGPVQIGDFILPSAEEDGTAVAVAPKALAASELGRVVGRAWEASTSADEKLVNVVVGIDEGAAAAVVIASLQEELRSRDDDFAARLGILEAAFASLR